MNRRLGEPVFWATALFPVATASACILLAGTQMQVWVFSLLNSDVPSIYGSAFQQSLVEYPDLRTWFGSITSWPIALEGMLIAIAITLRTEPRIVAWRATFAAFVVQSIFDIQLGWTQGQISLTWIIENLIGNVVGSALFAMIVVGLFAASDFVFNHLPGREWMQRLIAAAAVLLCGFGGSAAIYYLGDFFYRPLPVSLDTYLAPPISGAFSPQSAASGPSAGGKLSGRPFSFLPDVHVHGRATWTSPPGGLVVSMIEPTDHSRPRISISLYAGCSTTEAIEKLESSVPWGTFEDAGELSLGFDRGPTDLFTSPQPTESSIFLFKSGLVSSFQLDEDGDSKNIKVTHFVGDGASLDVSSGARGQSFILSAPLFGADLEKLGLSSRVLTVKVGQRTVLVRFNPSKHPRADDPLKCVPLTAVARPNADVAEAITVDSGNVLVAARVRIDWRSDSQTLRIDNGGIHVEGRSGWVAFSGLPAPDLLHHELGALNMVQFRGNVSDLLVDGIAQTARPLDTYSAIGAFNAVYGDKGRVRVSGRATKLWKDQIRLNPTKWENLGWEAKLFLLGAMGSALALAARLISRRLRSNARFLWMA